jgi:hypothetical protein
MKYKKLRSAVNAPEYNPEEKVTSWAKIIRSRLENGREVFVPELAEQMYNNHGAVSILKARSAVLALKKRLESTSDQKLLRCHAPNRYLLVDDNVNSAKEHGKRAKVTSSYINSVKRSFESIDAHHPALLLEAKQMVWQLENHLRDMEAKALGEVSEVPQLTAKRSGRKPKAMVMVSEKVLDKKEKRNQYAREYYAKHKDEINSRLKSKRQLVAVKPKRKYTRRSK